MWQKSKSIWEFIYNKFLNNYDYFLIGGDDMIYFIENLRAYLNSEEIKNYQKVNNGTYLGNRFYPSGFNNMSGKSYPFIFNSGGAGYILDRKALKILGKDISDGKCYPNLVTSAEDVQISRCLEKFNILPYDTRDELKEERFHPFNPHTHYTYRRDPKDWYTKYKYELKYGLECCSKDSVSFHYLTVSFKIFKYFYSYIYLIIIIYFKGFFNLSIS